MRMTSAEAAKYLKKLNEDYEDLMEQENASKEFLAAAQENVEDCRPEYDYQATQEALAAVEKKIRTLKHALNVFNLTHTVPGFDMTIDEMLIYLPQLNKTKMKLAAMKNKLPRAREQQRGYQSVSSIIDYRYTNYDIESVKADYARISAELSRAQTALDRVNNAEEFEVEL